MAALVKEKPVAVESKNYKGFVAGVFSGIAKLTGTSFLFRAAKSPAARLTDAQHSSRPSI